MAYTRYAKEFADKNGNIYGAMDEEARDALAAIETAEASDEGKALKAKTVAGGKVTEWEFGETGPEIDDTAGAGDSTKVWSANKLATEKSSVLSAISAASSTQSEKTDIIANSLNNTSTNISVTWYPGWVNGTTGTITEKLASETNERYSNLLFLKKGAVITYSYSTKPLYIYSYGANNSFVGRLTYLWPSSGSSATYTLGNDLYIRFDCNANGNDVIDPTSYTTVVYKAEYSKIEALDERVTALENSGVSITVDTELSGSSSNPVQNSTISNAVDTLQSQIDAAVIPPLSPSTVTGGSSCVIIAASNASQVAQDNANYVCTGTDDQNTINAAIASLPATGGEIKLTNGLFVISGPIVISRPVKIVGEGNSIAGRASYTTTNGNTYSNLYGRNVGITTIRVDADVKGFQITSSSKIAGIEFRDFLLLGYGKDRASKPGFSFEATTDLTMFDNVGVCDCYIAIYQDSTYYMDAPNIINSSFQWCGCAFVGKAIYGRISGCCIADNIGIGTYAGLDVNCGGIMLNSGGNMIISNNVIARPTTYADPTFSQPGCAIRLKSCSVVNISDNIITGTQGNNIEAASATHVTINGNTITNPGIASNASYECNIYLGSGCGEFIVTGNRMGKANLSDSGTALYPFYNSTSARGRCVIAGNIFYGTANAPYYTDSSTVSDNNVTYSA